MEQRFVSWELRRSLQTVVFVLKQQELSFVGQNLNINTKALLLGNKLRHQALGIKNG